MNSFNTTLKVIFDLSAQLILRGSTNVEIVEIFCVYSLSFGYRVINNEVLANLSSITECITTSLNVFFALHCINGTYSLGIGTVYLF